MAATGHVGDMQGDGMAATGHVGGMWGAGPAVLASSSLNSKACSAPEQEG